jgi:MoaA/NifB/PqqE/SkfB family radical SAM enzyme
MSRKLLDKNFCVIPWTGFEVEPNGEVKNCVISKDIIGNIHQTGIEEIITNNPLRKRMLDGEYPSNCEGCYLQEKHRPKNFDSISSRLYYTKELATKIPKNLFDSANNFSLKHIDVRWSNSCNQACVYCGPVFSSKWAKEMGVEIPKNRSRSESLKKYIYKNIKTLENVYLAGGEPLLMKENKDFLDKLYEANPDCTIRVNTNLSKTNTGVMESVCKFKNVHWTISIEAIEEKYEYIRHHGNWKDFLINLNHIKKLGHKISFNMLYFILTYDSVFQAVKYLQNLGFHNNSFVIGPLYTPKYLNVLNLPDAQLEKCKDQLKMIIGQKPGFLYQNSLENILSYLTDTKFYANIEATLKGLKDMDLRRNNDSKKVFPEFYREVAN